MVTPDQDERELCEADSTRRIGTESRKRLLVISFMVLPNARQIDQIY